jgi:hypothetical protein
MSKQRLRIGLACVATAAMGAVANASASINPYPETLPSAPLVPPSPPAPPAPSVGLPGAGASVGVLNAFGQPVICPGGGELRVTINLAPPPVLPVPPDVTVYDKVGVGGVSVDTEISLEVPTVERPVCGANGAAVWVPSEPFGITLPPLQIEP